MLNIIILAAGLGKRMQSDLPKVLHPIAGKPMLAHVLDSARALTPDRIVVVAGHGAERVQAAFAGQDLCFALQQPQLGTGHAVMQALPCDAYIGAAAVADFTPRAPSAHKIKKQPGQDVLVLELVKTRDILAEVAASAQRPRLVVGFAAETDHVAEYARGKLERKRLDLICANRVGCAGGGFECDDNALLVIDAAGERALGPAPKGELAGQLLDIVAERLA